MTRLTWLLEEQAASTKVAPAVNDVACTHSPVYVCIKMSELTTFHSCVMDGVGAADVPHDVTTTGLPGCVPWLSRHANPSALFCVIHGVAGSAGTEP